MALCSYSSKLAMDSYTVLDNVFLSEFLPSATGDDVKVYLYGLSLCSNPNTEDNNFDTISKVLSMSEKDIIRSFEYWQEMGLVQIVATDPFQVRYLPAKKYSGSSKLRTKEKYSDFNKQIQEIITGRMIGPIEFNEYYSLIETYHFEPEAVLLIAKYCTHLKSSSISYPYIVAVAKTFAEENLKTFEAVEKKFIEQEKSADEIEQVLALVGSARKADIEERNMYLKWTKTFGFTHGVIVSVAKTLKKKGGFSKLNELLTKYYEMKLFSVKEINDFSEKQEIMLGTAKIVVSNLGLFYQTYDNVVSTYISEWYNKGYDEKSLAVISNYCFKQNVKSLEGMNTVVQKFYKLGLVSTEAIAQYFEHILAEDNKIKQILDETGLLRSVSSFDRELYKTWTENWNYSHEEIIIVSKSAKDKANPIAYINKLIASLHEKNIHGEKAIAKYLESTPIASGVSKTTTKATQNYMTHNYTSEELNAVFDSLDDVEI